MIRHTQPQRSMSGRCYGSLDVALSSSGIDDARNIAESLRGIGFAAIYSSPLTRARDTAAPLARAARRELLVDQGLREISFGDFEGRSYEEIEQRYPDLFAAWMESPTKIRFPSGESFEDVKLRAWASVNSIVERHSGDVVAIVTHGGVLRSILVAGLEMSDHAAFRLEQSYGAINIIDWVDSAPLLRVMNATAAMVACRDEGFIAPYAFGFKTEDSAEETS
jgi:alpha-ribazole phosphatase